MAIRRGVRALNEEELFVVEMLFLRIVNGNCTILSEYGKVLGQVRNNRDYNGV